VSPSARPFLRTLVAALAAAATVALAVGCGGGGGGDTAATDGPTIFADSGCANCHSFAAADANGRVGPDLDDSTLTEEEVVAKVRDGGGGMPSFGELSEAQLQALAEFVVGQRGR